MPIKHIRYQSQQIQNMQISGYSLYVNESFYVSTATIQEVEQQARLYSAHNDVEIYPLMKQETTMSKVKEQMIQEQQDEFELELSYQEYLRDNRDKPNEDELNEMEHDCITQPYFGKSRIIAQKPLNNANYNPLHTTGA